MPVLTVGPDAIPYEVRRSRRARRGRLVVAAKGVEVVVPEGTSEARVRGILERGGPWIERKWAALRRSLATHPGSSHLVTGATVPFRGRPVPLRIVRSGDGEVDVGYDDGFVVALPAWVSAEARDGIVESALRLWLKRRVRVDALDLVRHHGERHGLLPRSIRIKDQKSLWGSCTSGGDISLNWRLVFAPEAVLEYVVVHELCHLRVRNHGPAFWRLVREVLPGFEPHRRWLKRNGHMLSLKPGG
jgi:predicted metal-dependent hydrolase